MAIKFVLLKASWKHMYLVASIYVDRIDLRWSKIYCIVFEHLCITSVQLSVRWFYLFINVVLNKLQICATRWWARLVRVNYNFTCPFWVGFKLLCLTMDLMKLQSMQLQNCAIIHWIFCVDASILWFLDSIWLFCSQQLNVNLSYWCVRWHVRVLELR